MDNNRHFNPRSRCHVRKEAPGRPLSSRDLEARNLPFHFGAPTSRTVCRVGYCGGRVWVCGVGKGRRGCLPSSVVEGYVCPPTGPQTVQSRFELWEGRHGKTFPSLLFNPWSGVRVVSLVLHPGVRGGMVLQGPPREERPPTRVRPSGEKG